MINLCPIEFRFIVTTKTTSTTTTTTIPSHDQSTIENGEWEEELQKDLQEFELVSGDVSALDEEALDRDIMEMKKNLR